jgi:hypothetical protein
MEEEQGRYVIGQAVEKNQAMPVTAGTVRVRIPQDDAPPKFAQLTFYDSANWEIILTDENDEVLDRIVEDKTSPIPEVATLHEAMEAFIRSFII